MKHPKFILFIALFLLSLGPETTNAQIIKPSYHQTQATIANIELNPFHQELKVGAPWKGYAREFFAFELGYLGGAAITSGLFIVGFISALGGNADLAVPLIIGSGITALATPILAGYLMDLAGKKYRPEGKLGTSILASYLGVVVTVGGSLLINYLAVNLRSNQENYNDLSRSYYSLNTIASLLVPGLIAVSIYNIFPKSEAAGNGNALLNRSGGKFAPGIPSISISQNPLLPGVHFTQFKLLSVNF